MSDTESAEHSEHGEHPDASQYIVIGIILAVFTAIEVAISFMTLPQDIAVPSLVILTVLKFALVILWFMHLRFDSGWYRRLFLFGLAIALGVYAATVSLMLYAGSNQAA